MSRPPALLLLLLAGALAGPLAGPLPAADYAVLVLQKESDPDAASRSHMQTLCTELNRRCAESERLPAYFGLVRTRNGEDLLLYGWRPPVRGLLREDFPRTRDGLRRIDAFAEAHWRPLAWLRQRLADTP